jgi:hypothetical protein
VVTGRDLVVVGVVVWVVVVVVVVVVVASDERPPEEGPAAVEVVEVEAPGSPVEVVEVEAPGFSLATTTPMRAVVPVATIATARVRRRNRRLARRRTSMAFLAGSGMDPSDHFGFRAAAHRTVTAL